MAEQPRVRFSARRSPQVKCISVGHNRQVINNSRTERLATRPPLFEYRYIIKSQSIRGNIFYRLARLRCLRRRCSNGILHSLRSPFCACRRIYRKAVLLLLRDDTRAPCDGPVLRARWRRRRRGMRRRVAAQSPRGIRRRRNAWLRGWQGAVYHSGISFA